MPRGGRYRRRVPYGLAIGSGVMQGLSEGFKDINERREKEKDRALERARIDIQREQLEDTRKLRERDTEKYEREKAGDIIGDIKASPQGLYDPRLPPHLITEGKLSPLPGGREQAQSYVRQALLNRGIPESQVGYITQQDPLGYSGSIIDQAKAKYDEILGAFGEKYANQWRTGTLGTKDIEAEYGIEKAVREQEALLPGKIKQAGAEADIAVAKAGKIAGINAQADLDKAILMMNQGIEYPEAYNQLVKAKQEALEKLNNEFSVFAGDKPEEVIPAKSDETDPAAIAKGQAKLASYKALVKDIESRYDSNIQYFEDTFGSARIDVKKPSSPNIPLPPPLEGGRTNLNSLDFMSDEEKALLGYK